MLLLLESPNQQIVLSSLKINSVKDTVIANQQFYECKHVSEGVCVFPWLPVLNIVFSQREETPL